MLSQHTVRSDFKNKHRRIKTKHQGWMFQHAMVTLTSTPKHNMFTFLRECITAQVW